MKKFFAVLMLATLAAGCATTKTIDPNYQAYLAEVAAWRTIERKPLLKFEVDSNGLIRGLEVHLPPERVEVKPYEPKIHPGWSLAGTTVKAAASVIGLGLITDAIVDLASISGQQYNYNDSFNSVGRDYNHLHDIRIQDGGNFNPTWDYSSTVQDSYNTHISDSFHFGSHNSYVLSGAGANLTQGDQTWNLGAPWGFLE